MHVKHENGAPQGGIQYSKAYAQYLQRPQWTYNTDIVRILRNTDIVRKIKKSLFSCLQWCLSVQSSLVEEGWYQLSAFINFCILNRPKKNSNSTQIVLFQGFQGRQNLHNSLVRWQSSRLQVWVQVQAPACHLAITSKGNYSRTQSKVLTAKSMAGHLGQLPGTAWAVQTGKHQHRTFPSQVLSLLVMTGSLEENFLCHLWYWLSLRVEKVSMLCKIWAVITDFFLVNFVKWNFLMDFARTCYQPKQHSASTHHFAESFNHSLVSE